MDNSDRGGTMCVPSGSRGGRIYAEPGSVGRETHPARERRARSTSTAVPRRGCPPKWAAPPTRSRGPLSLDNPPRKELGVRMPPFCARGAAYQSGDCARRSSPAND